MLFSLATFIIGFVSIVQISIALRTHNMERLAGAIIILPFGAMFMAHLIHGGMAVRRLQGVRICPEGIYFDSDPNKLIRWTEIHAEHVPLNVNAFKSPGIRARLPDGDVLFFPATARGSQFIRLALKNEGSGVKEKSQ